MAGVVFRRSRNRLRRRRVRDRLFRAELLAAALEVGADIDRELAVRDVAFDEGGFMQLHGLGFDVADHPAANLDGAAADGAFDVRILADDQMRDMHVTLDRAVDQELPVP
eukprot:gene17982-21528_t